MVAVLCAFEYFDQNNDIYSGLGEDTNIVEPGNASQDKHQPKTEKNGKAKSASTPQKSEHELGPEDGHREKHNLGEIGVSSQQRTSEEKTTENMDEDAGSQDR